MSLADSVVIQLRAVVDWQAIDHAVCAVRQLSVLTRQLVRRQRRQDMRRRRRARIDRRGWA